MNTTNVEQPLSLNQQTAQRILNFREDLNLHMKQFVGKIHRGYSTNELLKLAEHPCETCFCAAGELARLDNFPREFFNGMGGFDFRNYSKSLVENEKTKEFLFHAAWTNSREDLMARARYVLKWDTVPEFYSPEDYFSFTFTYGVDYD